YHVYSDNKGQTFSDPISLFSADYVALVHNGASLTVDKNDNVWVAFMMFKDPNTENHGGDSDNSQFELNVIVHDRSGKMIDKTTFDLDAHAFANIAQTDKGTILGYTNKQGAQIVTLEI
ncbi:MAG: hypothetical protein OPY06_05105, partial [Nitrosopumilus sp.]|nr:hypothetical protein [Nitrosopumilus sp.]